jgi:putative DNA primase/helicase
MVELAKSEREIVAYVDRFDSDPFKLTVENGTIDLRTRQLQPHDPSDYITKLAPVVYSETTTSALWERFIADIICQDKSLQEYLQRIFGYCLTTYHLLASKKLIEKRMVLPQ